MFESMAVLAPGPGAAQARLWAVDALERQELRLVTVLGRMRLAETLARVPGGTDWQGPAQQAFATVRDEIVRLVGQAATSAEDALAETRSAIGALAHGSV